MLILELFAANKVPDTGKVVEVTGKTDTSAPLSIRKYLSVLLSLIDIVPLLALVEDTE